MKKLSIDRHFVQHKFCLIIVFVSLVFSAALLYKLHLARQGWQTHAVQTLQAMDELKEKNETREAGIIAVTIGQTQGLVPFFQQQQLLQEYIDTIASETGHNIVVVDKEEKVVASTSEIEGVTNPIQDQVDSVQQTLSDGQPRYFIANGKDKNAHAVVTIRDDRGVIIGGVIYSETE